jgi:hypothetical protein
MIAIGEKSMGCLRAVKSEGVYGEKSEGGITVGMRQAKLAQAHRWSTGVGSTAWICCCIWLRVWVRIC